MKLNELYCIHSSLYHARETIQQLGCPAYPYAEFKSAVLRKMFYDLNRMCMTITRMAEQLEGGVSDAETE